MAKHADPTGVPDTADEWLDEFSTFSIYQVLPKISEMELLTIGTLLDMYSEMKNDEAPEAYNRIPTQQDFDRF